MTDSDVTQRTAMKTFRDAVAKFLGDGRTSGDVCLAAYLLQHGLGADPRDLAWIGFGDDAEFLALNAVVPAGGNFIVLSTGGDPSVRSKEKYLDLMRQLEEDNFPVRAQIVDLALASRWPQILSALAVAPVGVLCVNAEWAAAEPQFWQNLAAFWKTTPAVVCVRGGLDFENADVSVAFLRSLPPGLEIEVIAATSRSIWLAPQAPAGGSLSAALHGAGLFMPQSPAPGAGVSRPVVVGEECRPEILDKAGRLPGAVYRANSSQSSRVSLAAGWAWPEEDGCWTDGASAKLTLILPAHFPTPERLVVSGNAWLHPSMNEQSVSITVGNDAEPRCTRDFTTGNIEVLEAKLTPEDTEDGTLSLRFDVAAPGRPSEFGGEDTRMLGFKLRSIRLFG